MSINLDKISEKTIDENFVCLAVNEISKELLGISDNFDRVIGVKPSKKIFIGTLSEKSDDYKEWKTMIAPYSMSVEFLVPKSDIESGSLTIIPSFDLYCRVFPTYDEQCNFLLSQHSNLKMNNLVKIKMKSADLCPVFQRKHFRGDPITINLLDLSGSDEIPLGKRYADALNKIKLEVANAPCIYRSRETSDSKLLTECMGNENDFKKYINSRSNAKTPNWQFDLVLKGECLSTGELLVSVMLENTARHVRSNPHDETLFNCGVEVSLDNISLRPFKIDYIRDEYNRHAEMYIKSMNCSAEYKKEKDSIVVSHLPIVYHKRKKPRNSINGTIPTFEQLSKDPIEVLEEIANSMQRSIREYKIEYEKRELQLDRGEALKFKRDIESFEDELDAFRGGIIILKDNVDALKSFKLMNRTMMFGAGGGAWYLYQIVFIVSRLCDVIVDYIETDIKKKWDEHKGTVDVIRVPTGGGKTFTYLGLAIFTAFFDRLMGKTFGVSCWIKFPLRMLSLQQLEIIAKFTSYANEIKNSERLSGDPIMVGYFVGGGNTPNQLDKAFEELEDSDGRNVRFRIVSQCPFCENEVMIQADKSTRHIYHVCTNCKRKLPIVVIDEEIYRTLPTFIISTLDKVIISNVNENVKGLLGAKVKDCPKCGYNNTIWCISGEWRGGRKVYDPNDQCEHRKNGKCEKDSLNGSSPTLLIQDEMHLIREDHGTLDAHYETLIDKMIEKMTNKNLKIISATATIAGVEKQVNELYKRGARIFPTSPYVDECEEFYFEQSRELHRVVIGIMPHNRATNYTVYMILYHYWKFLQNSLNNIGALSRTLQCSKEDLKTCLFGRYYTMLSYHTSKRAVEESKEGIDGIVNQMLDRDRVPKIFTEKITGEKSLADIKELMDRIESADPLKKISLIAATKMISHGIDFDQLNAMVFEGMPRNVSEYIQAMSRVGRKYPALVFVVFHAGRERDHSYYRYYNAFHERLDTLIENVPLSRWAKNSVKMVLPGAILTSLHTYFADRDNRSYIKVSDLIWGFRNGSITYDDITEAINEGLHTNEQEYFKEVVDNDSPMIIDMFKKKGEKKRLSDVVNEEMPNSVLFSFRSIDDQVKILPAYNCWKVLEKLRGTTLESTEGGEKTPTEVETEGCYDTGKDEVAR